MLPKMRPNGQAAAFMIVAAVLIILLAIIMNIAGVTQIEKEQAEITARGIQTSITPLQEYITGCLRKNAEEGLLILGTQGGYIYSQTPPGYVAIGDTNVHFGFLLGYNTVPSREDIGKFQLGRYVNEKIEDCVGEFSQFTNLGKITVGEPETTATINDNNVVFYLHLPITISTLYQTTTISDFTISAPVRLGHLIDIEDEIAAKTTLNQNWIDVTYLRSLDVQATGTPITGKKVLYSLIDPQSRISGTPYVYQFSASLYNNSVPEMLQIPDMTIRTGETKTFTVAGIDFANQAITYRIESAISTIDPNTGVITIKPRTDDIGTHLTVVHARNTAGLESTQLFFIEVTR